MNREYIVWESPILRRPMELLWYGHAGRPMIWFPTSQGRFSQNEDFGLIAAVADLIEQGTIHVACVDSVDSESFYAAQSHPAQRLTRHDEYDRYVYHEVVPWVRARAYTDRRVAMIRVLESKGIPHRGHIWGAPYGHDWPWGKVQIRHYGP